jgi:hypothetical protein
MATCLMHHDANEHQDEVKQSDPERETREIVVHVCRQLARLKAILKCLVARHVLAPDRQDAFVQPGKKGGAPSTSVRERIP